MSPSAPDIIARHASVTDGYLRRVISERLSDAPPRLVEAIAYSLFAGGKRLRPALVLETAGAILSDPGKAAVASTLASAGAIELIHTFSLVHDDLPAMDDDDLRRGRPTSHKVFGEALAILAGDAMTTLAFELIATDADPQVVPALARELAAAAGPSGMIGGQVLDIAAENQPLTADELTDVHRRKTGALIRAACRLGAIAAGADDTRLAAVTTYAGNLGLAFQIIDDVLDATSTPQAMGKATQKDASRGKNTFPAVLGIEQSRDRAMREAELAVAALRPLGNSASGLTALARFVLERTS